MPKNKTGDAVSVPVAARPTAWWLAMAVLALVVVMYFQTWHELWPRWTDIDGKSYTHGPLILLISLWLIYRAKPRVESLSLRPAVWAIPLVLVVSLAWLVLARASIMTLHAFLWPVLAGSALVATCGFRVAGILTFPLGFLWFAVPFWDSFNRSLQSATVLAVGTMNRLTHVPGSVVGDVVIIPQGQFHIASGCSGLHFFVVALAVAALAGEIHRDRLRVRALLLFVAAALALVTNWLRVYVIILAGYLTDMQSYLVRVDHYKFGWVVFGLAMAVFFLVLHKLPAPPQQADREADSSKAGTEPWGAGFIAGLAAVCALPAASFFSGPLSPGPSWEPHFVGAQAEVSAAYLSATGRVLYYYGNRYLEQHQGRELIGYENHLFEPSVFREVLRGQVRYDTQQGAISPVEVMADRNDGQTWVAMYRYRVGGKWINGDLATQLAIGLRSLWGSVPAGIEAVAAPCSATCEDVRVELAVLLAQLARKES
jgi:EpsI family protein